MKETPFLLASRIVDKEKGEGQTLEWVLCRAAEAAIVDNAAVLSFFGKFILAAPEEQLLEQFYGQLGAKPLSSRMAVENIPQSIRPGTSSDAIKLRKHILERLTIFLSQHGGGRKHSDYSTEFLNKGDNFVVQEAGRIKIRYTYRDGKTVQQHLEVSRRHEYSDSLDSVRLCGSISLQGNYAHSVAGSWDRLVRRGACSYTNPC